MNEPLMTVDEVASYMRVRKETVWTWCRQRVLPAFKVGREWRIRGEDLDRKLRSMELDSVAGVQEMQTGWADEDE